jgi:Ca2+-binding RTX toxin-like protein
MSTYIWTTLNHGDSLTFNPASDVLHFDDPTISAADIRFDGTDDPPYTIFTNNGKTITLDGAEPLSLTSTAITFSNGTVLIIGDNAIAVPTAPGIADDATNTIAGTIGNDLLVFGGGSDNVAGHDGDDVLSIVYMHQDVSYGDAMVDGGSGFDTLVFFDSIYPASIDLAAGTATGGDQTGSVQTLISIENVIATAADDTIIGDGGNNRIEGLAGNDSISGGAGVDTASYESSTGAVIVNLADNILTTGGFDVQPETARDGYGTIDTLGGIEDVVGSDFNDFLRGSDAGNVLEGGGGNDILVGGRGSDTASDVLKGGSGSDQLRVTRGSDFLDGGDGGNDRLMFNNNAGDSNSTGLTYSSGIGGRAVHVDLGMSMVDYDTLDPVNPLATVIDVEFIWGTAGDDSLIGGSFVKADSGNFRELFRPGEGNDTIDGQGSGFNAYGVTDVVEYNNISDIPVTTGVFVNLGATAITLGGLTVGAGQARDSFGDTDTLIGITQVNGTMFGDTLIGGIGGITQFESFQGNAGNDYIDGGAGNDEVSYQAAAAAVNVNLTTGVATGGDGTDTFLNIERVRGSQFNDTITGSGRLDVVEIFIGDRGNDAINGGAGIDFASWHTTNLSEGGVTAFINNGSGTVTHATMGTDALINIEGLMGTNTDDVLLGGLGNQWFRGRGGSDVISGGAGIDTADYSGDRSGVIVNLEAGTATDGWSGVWAMGGTDSLDSIENVRGSQFIDYIIGDSGANFLDGNLSNDLLEGGAGNDTLDGGLADDNVAGGDGNDTFIDKQGADTLQGDVGDDTFLVNYLAGSAVTAIGGMGIDTYVLSPTTAAHAYQYRVTDFALGQGGDRIDVSPILDASAAQGFYAGQNPFTGGYLRLLQSGADTLVQYDFNGGGNSYLTGITLAGITATSVSQQHNFLGFIVGTTSDDDLGGTPQDDIILGLAGNDSLSGGAGNDQLYGGSGVDTMVGGAGDDTYHVDNTGDVVRETSNKPGALLLPGADETGPGLADGSGITDTVIAAIDYSLGAFVENLQLSGKAASGFGNSLANVLTGNAGNDELVGSGGNDTLDGGAGSDIMNGGAGNDVFFVNAALDQVQEAAGSTGGKDTVNSTVSETLDDNVETLVLLGSKNINGNGNSSANTITGNERNNTLDGKVGADKLNGAGGNDVLIWDPLDTYDGGTGTDTLKVAAGDLNLTTVANTKIKNIEQIDLTNGGDNKLTLNLTDLLALSSSTDSLKVLGAAGDSVDIVGNVTVQSTAGGFRTYAFGSGFLQIDTDITVT